MDAMRRRLEIIQNRKRAEEMWDEPCPKCPSAHFPHDPESEQMEKWFKEGVVGHEALFVCAWRPTKMCKGLCDNWGVTPEELKQCCQIHGVHWDKWFLSKTVQGAICPECIKAGFFIEAIFREWVESKAYKIKEKSPVKWTKELLEQETQELQNIPTKPVGRRRELRGRKVSIEDLLAKEHKGEI